MLVFLLLNGVVFRMNVAMKRLPLQPRCHWQLHRWKRCLTM
jgi:hypothetical protein